MTNTASPMDVHHIAQLAHIPITENEKGDLEKGFVTVLTVLDTLKKISVDGIDPIHQVTGFENVYREDVIEMEHSFTQAQALANAPKSYNGFFLVDRVLEK